MNIKRKQLASVVLVLGLMLGLSGCHRLFFGHHGFHHGHGHGHSHKHHYHY